MAAYPSTLYRLDDDGEVYEVVVEETDESDEAPQIERAPATMSAGRPEEAFDEITWWSRQLGRVLTAD